MDKKSRIDLMLALRGEGKTLAEIGNKFSITRERVRQICQQFGVFPTDRKKKLKAEKPRNERKRRFWDIREPVIYTTGRDPYVAFMSHRSGSKTRHIEFRLTFPEWWQLWAPHFHNRGKKADQFCMCRYMDKGAYEIGNVLIKTQKENAQEQALVHKTRYYFRNCRAKYGNADVSSYHDTNPNENEV